MALGARTAARARDLLVATTGFALLGVPLVRYATGGPGWLGAWSDGLMTVIAGDLIMMLGGVICLGLWRFGAGTSAEQAGQANSRPGRSNPQVTA